MSSEVSQPSDRFFPCSTRDYLGIKNHSDLQNTIARIQRSYQENNPDHDAASPPNDDLVRQTLRLIIADSGELMPYFFDSTLESTDNFKLTTDIFSETKKQEIALIRSMNPQQRSEFSQKTWRSLSSEDDSYGPGVFGFAIEPNTLEILVTSDRYGDHNAKDQLAEKIARNNDNPLSKDKIKKTLFGGLIYQHIDGFASPILRLLDRPDQNQHQNLISFLQFQNVIPVDGDGFLVE